MIEVNDASFEAEVMESDIPVVVDFFASWCGPCKMMVPVLKDVSKEFEGTVKFVKVNIDTTKIAQEFDVRAVPTLAIIKHGVVVDTLVGMRQQSQLTAWLMINL